jgi:hypothetical protein
MTRIDEPITVGAVFDHGQVRPAWFLWQGRRYDHCRVTMRWQTTEGASAILHLAVSDGSTVFELTMNHRTLAWRLAAVDEG